MLEENAVSELVLYSNVYTLARHYVGASETTKIAGC